MIGHIMTYQGTLKKCKTTLSSPIVYELPVGDDYIHLNPLIGKHLTITFKNEIYCVSCNKKIKKSFMQGYCYPCMISSSDTAECIIRPELCRGHLGEGRDPQWELDNHVQPHYVYLAVSSGLKVGVTRSTQVPTRWIDQGASYALIFATVPNRYLAGCIEVALKQYVGDKTAWQRMLKNDIAHHDLIEQKNKLKPLLSSDLQAYVNDNDEITDLNFPVTAYPEKVKSLSFDKQDVVSGILTGIKGQYLYFDTNTVLNVRKFTGYKVEVNY